MAKTNGRARPKAKGVRRRILYASLPDQADRICSGCETCQMMCSLEHTGAFNPKKSRIKVTPLSVGVTIPITCQQCENPACQAACPYEAIVPQEKMNLLVGDEKKCTGCLACVGACPFGIMGVDPEKKKAIKCDLCGGEPECVRACPSRVLVLADPRRTAEAQRRRFAAVLAGEEAFARHNIAGAEQVKTLPATVTQLAAQAGKPAEGGK